MKDIGILYTEANRLAVVEDRKWMTRRLPASFKEINEKPDEWDLVEFRFCGERMLAEFENKVTKESVYCKIPYAVGDLIYIRETWATDKMFDKMSYAEIVATKVATIPIWYKDNDIQIERPGQERGRWRSLRFMPKYAARQWRRVSGVKVERLQSISEADCIAEGIRFDGTWWRGGPHPVKGGTKVFATAVLAYADLWDSINGPGAWELNPWLVAVSFERIAR